MCAWSHVATASTPTAHYHDYYVVNVSQTLSTDNGGIGISIMEELEQTGTVTERPQIAPLQYSVCVCEREFDTKRVQVRCDRNLLTEAYVGHSTLLVYAWFC